MMFSLDVAGMIELMTELVNRGEFWFALIAMGSSLMGRAEK